MRKSHTLACLSAAVMAVAPWCVPSANAATDRYRVELLVFRHSGGVTEPIQIERLRGFHDRWALDATNGSPASGAPRPIETAGTFSNLYRRLERLDDYTPLAVMTWEQPAMDYQPDVRVHDTEIIREDIYFPGEMSLVNLDQSLPFEGHTAPLYRLDGTAQLRRSRFLHIDLDLEWRVDAEPEPPAPLAEMAVPPVESTTGPDIPLPEKEPANVLDTEELDEAEAGPEPDPFRIHRLRQSRQVETDTLIYFDSDFLGALARVTALDAE